MLPSVQTSKQTLQPRCQEPSAAPPQGSFGSILSQRIHRHVSVWEAPEICRLADPPSASLIVPLVIHNQARDVPQMAEKVKLLCTMDLRCGAFLSFASRPGTLFPGQAIVTGHGGVFRLPGAGRCPNCPLAAEDGCLQQKERFSGHSEPHFAFLCLDGPTWIDCCRWMVQLAMIVPWSGHGFRSRVVMTVPRRLPPIHQEHWSGE